VVQAICDDDDDDDDDDDMWAKSLTGRQKNTNFLHFLLMAFSVDVNVINFAKRKNCGHSETRSSFAKEYAMSQLGQFTCGSKQVPTCTRNIV